MAYLNTTEEIEQEIEKVNKLYNYKAFIYNEKNKGLNYYNNENYNFNIRLEYIETELNALKNMEWTFHNEYINIKKFECIMNPSEQIYDTIDIRKTKKLIVPKSYEFRRDWKMFSK